MVTTPNYAYNLPAVGGDFETWGDKLNFNWAKIDTDLKDGLDLIEAAGTAADDANTNANGRVAKTGDTMTGMLVLPSTEPTSVTHAAKKAYVDAGELSQVSRYQFSVGLTDADPGTGAIGFNHANGRLATLIFVSKTCFNGKATPAFNNFLANVIIGLSKIDKTIFYRVVSAVENASWYTLTVAALSTGSGGIAFPAPAAASALVLTFLGFDAPEEAPVAAYTDIDCGALAATQHVYTEDNPYAPELPSRVEVLLRCDANDSGYAVNDWVSAVGSNPAGKAGLVSAWNTASVYAIAAEHIYLPSKSSGSIVEVTAASWQVFLRVWS